MYIRIKLSIIDSILTLAYFDRIGIRQILKLLYAIHMKTQDCVAKLELYGELHLVS